MRTATPISTCSLITLRSGSSAFGAVRATVGSTGAGAGAGAAAGAGTVRFEVAEVLLSGFTTCRVHVRAVVPTLTATEIAVAVRVAGVSEVTVPPE